MVKTYATDPLIAKLRAERGRQKLSLEQVAQKIGRGTPQSIWQWESGTNNPTLANLRAWAAALGLQLALTPRPAAAVLVDLTEIFAFDTGPGQILPISAEDAQALKSPTTRRHLLHAWRTDWEPVETEAADV